MDTLSMTGLLILIVLGLVFTVLRRALWYLHQIHNELREMNQAIQKPIVLVHPGEQLK